MKLIREMNEELSIIVEEINSKKELFIEGIFLQAEVVNGNGRKYPKAIMEEKTEYYIENKVNKMRAMGELGHPNSPKIIMERVSHIITNLSKEGNNWIGKAKILDTPMGNIVRGLHNGGVKFGVSSRALGSVKQDATGCNIVQEDFFIITAADIVADPSAPDAFVEGIMEDLDWVIVDGKYTYSDKQEAKKYINTKYNDQHKLDIFVDFIKKINL